MRRIQILALLLLAAIVAAEPLLHEHPLLQSQEATVCAACAAATAQLAVHTPTLVAPLAVAYQLVAVSVTGHSFDAPLPLASRAPPTA
jgi:hypothetical protein